jgi:hypothetical protein
MGPSRKRKRTDEETCQRKLCHRDYFSALLHAQRLADENLIIYPCPVCDGIHSDLGLSLALAVCRIASSVMPDPSS